MKALIGHTGLLALTRKLFGSGSGSGEQARPSPNADLLFRSLIENGTEIINLLDEHFCPLYRSPSSFRLTGWTMNERTGFNIMEITHPDDQKVMRRLIDDVLANPGKPFPITYRNLCKGGHYIWLTGSATNSLHDPHVQAIVVNLHDISESKKAEALLQDSYEEIRMLASHLQDVREEERTSMAREIHDELGQQLTGLKMDVSWLNRKADLGDAATREKIKGILTLIDKTVNTVRRLAAELRPSILDDLGLAEALDWNCKEFQNRSGIRCTFQAQGDKIPLPPVVTTGLFRIYQEALTNVARHAGAKSVNASLVLNPEQAALTISDDGKGFDVKSIGAKKTLGLLGMKERTLMMGGNYEFISGPDHGTTLKVTVPLKDTFPQN